MISERLTIMVMIIVRLNIMVMINVRLTTMIINQQIANRHYLNPILTPERQC